MGLFGKKKINGLQTYGQPSMADNLTRGVKNFVNKVAPPKTPEQLEYEKRLREATEKARRDSYLKEAIKQSHLKGRSEAKKKYNTPASDPIANIDKFANNLLGGMADNPMGKKSNLKKKMKKDSEFDKLMWG